MKPASAVPLDGKVLVITGASSGIGLCLAKKACALGAMVVLAARSEDKLIALADSLGGRSRALPVTTDVTRRQDHVQLLEKAVEAFGKVDVYVNNAGRGINRSILEVSDEDWDDMMNVNARSALYGMQVAYPYFKQREAGHIINISSVLGRLPFPTYRSTYCASKHALNSITTSVRLEANNAGLKGKVHVSLVSPGLINTEFGMNVIGQGRDARNLPDAQPVEEVCDVILDVIQSPRAEAYTKEEHAVMVADYFSAPRVEEIEANAPWYVPTHTDGGQQGGGGSSK